jgi:hypothetical protein
LYSEAVEDEVIRLMYRVNKQIINEHYRSLAQDVKGWHENTGSELSGYMDLDCYDDKLAYGLAATAIIRALIHMT